MENSEKDLIKRDLVVSIVVAIIGFVLFFLKPIKEVSESVDAFAILLAVCGVIAAVIYLCAVCDASNKAGKK